MNPSSTKPGLMLYFDLLPALRSLPAQSVGELLLAAMEYARSGAEPAFADQALALVWPFLRSAADRDEAAYAEKRQKGDWLVYCRSCKRQGTAPVPFEQWKLDGGAGRGCDDGAPEDNGALRDVNAALPTTTTTTTPTTTTAPTAQRGGGCAARGETAAPSPLPRDEAGLVLLTDGEYAALERELGKEELERTVKYLSDYCRLHGKRYGDWAFALRRASREGWGTQERLPRSRPRSRSCQPGDDFQPSAERIRKNCDWLSEFLEQQEAASRPGA